MNKDQLKSDLIQDQKETICAWCKKGRYCPDCEDNKQHNEHRWQEVGWLDHNHNHIDCKGCKQCVRGLVHNMCNWNVIPAIQRAPHLQSEFAREYLNRGSGPYTNNESKVIKESVKHQKKEKTNKILPNQHSSMIDVAVEVIAENNNIWDKSINALYLEIEKRGYKSKGKTPANSLQSNMFHTPKGKRLFIKENSGTIKLNKGI